MEGLIWINHTEVGILQYYQIKNNNNNKEKTENNTFDNYFKMEEEKSQL